MLAPTDGLLFSAQEVVFVVVSEGVPLVAVV